MANKDRLAFGSIQYKHRGNTIPSIVGHPSMDKLFEKREELFSYKEGYVPNGYEHRPDLISHLFYGTVEYWWLLMVLNGVFDPWEGFNVGDRILLPKL